MCPTFNQCQLENRSCEKSKYPAGHCYYFSFRWFLTLIDEKC